MIDLRKLDAFRHAAWETSIAGGGRFPAADCGAFVIPSPDDGAPLRCMAAAGRATPPGLPPWDHVSVSRADRAPSWAEMDAVFALFFRPDEVAMQLHVSDADHVNYHPHCLHIWRPAGLKQIPRPPSWMVGPDSAKGRGKAARARPS